MADTFTWGEGGQKLSSTDLKRRMAYSLMKEGTSTAPVQHWLQGVDRVAKALIGGWEMSELDKAEKANQALQAKDDAILNGGGGAFSLGGTPATTATASLAPTATDGDTGSALPASLNTTESGGNWQAQNSAVGAGGMTGHFGRAQFGQARLQEAAAAGAIPQGTTPQMFMKSPELQKAAENWHFGDIDQNIRANGFDRMIGQSINGVPITMGGMRAVAHLGGNRGLQRFIETGGRYNPADANGTSLMDYFTTHGGKMRTAEADMPAPGAVPVQGSGGAEGFFIPPGQSDLPAMQPNGAFPNFDPATGRWLGSSPSAPASAAIQPDPPQPSVAAPEAQPAPQPLNPVFMSEGVDQPWMNSTFTPSANPREAIARALAKTQTLPPSRPADLAMPQADLPAPGAVQAMGQVPVSQPAPQPSYGEIDPNSPDGGARIGMLASEEARLGLPSGAGIMSPSEGMKAVAAALMQSRAGRDPLSTASTPIQRVAAALMPATFSPGASAAPTQTGSGTAPQAAWSSQPQTQGASPLANGPVPVPQAADPGTPQRQAQIGAAMRTLNNPNATAGSKLIAQQVIQQAFRGRELETVNRPDGSVWHVPKNGQGSPVQIFGPQNKPEDRTGDMKEYDIYVAQEKAAGRTPGDFTTWMRGNKSSGATQLNIDTKGSQAFATKANEYQAKRYFDMATSADEAVVLRSDVETLSGLLSGIQTGRGTEARLGLAQMAKGVGLDAVADKLTGGKMDEMEAALSIMDKLTPRMRVPGSGATSDMEMRTFRNALPSLLKQPGGNAIVSDTYRGMLDYQAQAGDIARQALRGEISQADADKALKELPSPFQRLKDYQKAQKEGASGAAAPQQPAPEARKSVGGKSYVKRGAEWFEE
ncbi:MAG: hypothetical protein J0I42_20225 [Bosea sp.]|uniref:hypothetical protein n=1 Tax=Bosea sp. (in: a-proteobacteria) TaxID=1871050 RepID=UPI001ACF91C9|nr:hypothetical protein [Bosea sp. (in: a-proteobacteria)]MBN9454270.1 hypothetical protein [Bosea sp. (in: a-proteobacteria)]